MAFGYRYWLVYAPSFSESTFLLFVHNPAGQTKLRDYSGGRERVVGTPSMNELFAATRHQAEYEPHPTTDVGYWAAEIESLNRHHLGHDPADDEPPAATLATAGYEAFARGAAARAQEALRAAFIASGGVTRTDRYHNYALSPRENASALTDQQWNAITADFQAGAGGELVAKAGAPAKLSAIHSSAMLAVNSFGRWRLDCGDLVMPDVEGCGSLCFERRCPSGLPGVPPTLDVVIETDGAIIAIESKLLEPLTPKRPRFAASYASAFAGLGSSPWRQRYDAINQNDCGGYAYLDAAQLLKHYLGLRATFATKHVTLVYVYWQPTNADSIAECRAHAEELERFGKGLADASVSFRAISYPELWEWWGQTKNHALLEHVARLRGRYGVSI